MKIGEINRKWKYGDKLQIYNAIEDSYWDAVITAEADVDDTGYQWNPTAILADGTSWPIKFNTDFNEWMIDE